MSEVFTNNILSHISGSTDGRCSTTYGTIIQGIALVILVALSDYAIKKGFL